jgi:transposase-like protein
VDLVESSGDSIAGFCKKHDLGYFRVLRWRKRLRSEAGDQESGPVLLPLRIVETENDRATKENGEAQWTVELEFGDYKARFAEGASEATMARALRAAQGLSC